MNRWVASVAVVAAVGAVLSGAPVSAVAGTPPTGVVALAHRGDAHDAPEHTLAALDQAVADHADRQSIDVRWTADHVPVVVHDATLARTTDVRQRFPRRQPFLLQDFTLAEIKTLDAGGWYGSGSYAGSRILTLDEVLDELAGSGAGLTVEIKDPRAYGGVAGIGRAVLDVIAAHPGWSTTGPNPQVLIESFDWAFLDGLHELSPAQALVLLGQVDPQDLHAHPYVREVDVRHDWLTADLVRAAQGRGVRVGTWTVDSAADIAADLRAGVDGITSNDPRLLVRLLATAGRSWTSTTWPATAPVTRVALDMPAVATVGRRAEVLVHPQDAGGGPERWRAVTVQTRVAGHWRDVTRTATDSHGLARISVPVTDGLQLRAVSDSVRSRVVVPSLRTAGTVPPPTAPSPSRAVPARRMTDRPGARPTVTSLSGPVWASMAGHTWQRGCPTARSALRLLRVSYWGFDGRRYRGELVASRRTVVRLGRVFEVLYRHRVPIRALSRPDSLGSRRVATTRALEADASFGFTCSRMPGDTHAVGSHARGDAVTLNPWENPTRLASGGVPNSWWLHAPGAPAVHADGSAVVAAFAAQGFGWGGSRGRPAEFRDLR